MLALLEEPKAGLSCEAEMRASGLSQRNAFCRLDDAAERVGRDVDAAFTESRLEILEPRIGMDGTQFKTRSESVEGSVGILGHPSQQVRLRTGEDVADVVRKSAIR